MLQEMDKFEISGGNKRVLELIPEMMQNEDYRMKLREITIQYLKESYTKRTK